VDLVADLRASTPTDAAKRIVPDVMEEWERISQQRQRARRIVERRIGADASDVTRAVATARRSVQRRIDHGGVDLEHLHARLTALSPASTLERGYAVLQTRAGAVVRDPGSLTAGETLEARVAGGAFTVSVEDLP
jgi:exodeoxyribonuclease VII large subunit